MPTDRGLSEAYAALRREILDPSRATACPDHGNPKRFSETATSQTLAQSNGPVLADRSRHGSTTSFSGADPCGNVIAETPPRGSLWDTGVMAENTGMFFNSGTRVGPTSPYPDDVNYRRGGPIPILNDSPIVVMRDGLFHLPPGTPGGETIGQTRFQLLLTLPDFGMGIQETIEAPRISLDADPSFCRSGSEVTVNVDGRIATEAPRRLGKMGHEVEVANEWAFGSMQGMVMDPGTETMTVGADPRRTGYAVGW